MIFLFRELHVSPLGGLAHLGAHWKDVSLRESEEEFWVGSGPYHAPSYYVQLDWLPTDLLNLPPKEPSPAPAAVQSISEETDYTLVGGKSASAESTA